MNCIRTFNLKTGHVKCDLTTASLIKVLSEVIHDKFMVKFSKFQNLDSNMLIYCTNLYGLRNVCDFRSILAAAAASIIVVKNQRTQAGAQNGSI